MMSLKRQTPFFLTLTIACFGFSKQLFGQYCYSALASGQSAFLASGEVRFSFIANPAYLGRPTFTKHLRMIFEGNYSEAEKYPFDPAFPDVELSYRLSNRFVIGIRKQYLNIWPEVLLWVNQRNGNQIPFPSADRNYQNYVEFKYVQGWSYGLGANLRTNFSVGLAVRHAQIKTLFSSDAFLTTDFGTYWEPVKRLKLAGVLRNVTFQKIEEGDFEYRVFYDTGNSQNGRWDIDFFSFLFIKPQRFGEVGLSYLLGHTLEILIDYSSRKEYAWGMRLFLWKNFSLSGGRSVRFDNLYNYKKIAISTIGCKICYKSIEVAMSGIISPSHSNHSLIGSNQYGEWSTSRLNPEMFLFSLSFEL